MAKKNIKKNKLKSKDRFRNSIITNDSIGSNIDDESITGSTNATSKITKTATNTRIQSLGSELKLIAVIGFTLFGILTISSFVI